MDATEETPRRWRDTYAPDILGEIARAGFKTPTPIQSQAWPVALQGRDLEVELGRLFLDECR